MICGRCGGITTTAGAVLAIGRNESCDRALAAIATTIMAAVEPTITILRWVIRSIWYIEALMTPDLALNSGCVLRRCVIYALVY